MVSTLRPSLDVLPASGDQGAPDRSAPDGRQGARQPPQNRHRPGLECLRRVIRQHLRAVIVAARASCWYRRHMTSTARGTAASFGRARAQRSPRDDAATSVPSPGEDTILSLPPSARSIAMLANPESIPSLSRIRRPHLSAGTHRARHMLTRTAAPSRHVCGVLNRFGTQKSGFDRLRAAVGVGFIPDVAPKWRDASVTAAARPASARRGG